RLSARALAGVRQVVDTEELTGNVVQEIIARHQAQVHELEQSESTTVLNQHKLGQRLTQVAIQSQREELLALRDNQQIDVELFHELENELDREEIQLQNATA
ncbi:MAG: hypothetical protein INR73_29410, partial [Williamsia sp.]|nr:hypothetical protein [Williamsia sp.]